MENTNLKKLKDKWSSYPCKKLILIRDYYRFLFIEMGRTEDLKAQYGLIQELIMDSADYGKISTDNFYALPLHYTNYGILKSLTKDLNMAEGDCNEQANDIYLCSAEYGQLMLANFDDYFYLSGNYEGKDIYIWFDKSNFDISILPKRKPQEVDPKNELPF